MPSWLKNVGQALIHIGKVVPVYGPILSAIIPGKTDDVILARAAGTIEQLSGIIITIEAAGAALALTGDQKLTAATPLFAQAFLQSSMLAGKEITDAALFQQGCSEAASAYVKILNSLKAPSV